MLPQSRVAVRDDERHEVVHLLGRRGLGFEREHIVRYVVPEGEALAKARELAAIIAKNTPDTNWRITNLLPRINDLSHDDGLFVEYLNSNMQRPPETAERLREFVEGRAKPLVAPGNRT